MPRHRWISILCRVCRSFLPVHFAILWWVKYAAPGNDDEDDDDNEPFGLVIIYIIMASAIQTLSHWVWLILNRWMEIRAMMIPEKLLNGESLRVTQVRTKHWVFIQLMIEYLGRHFDEEMDRWVGGMVLSFARLPSQPLCGRYFDGMPKIGNPNKHETCCLLVFIPRGSLLATWWGQYPLLLECYHEVSGDVPRKVRRMLMIEGQEVLKVTTSAILLSVCWRRRSRSRSIISPLLYRNLIKHVVAGPPVVGVLPPPLLIIILGISVLHPDDDNVGSATESDG